mmetsp:Transcript_26794/g.62622  ORF Transcript_26794/g.62622 Transcript_26794/m.62622 type:complete len:81 (-) Transcript_26794:1704-1946(-)
MHHLRTRTGPITITQSAKRKKAVENAPIAGLTSSCNNRPGNSQRLTKGFGRSSPVTGSISPVKNFTKTSRKQMIEMTIWI